MKKILTLIIALVFSLTLVTTSALASEGKEVTDDSKTALTASFDAKEGENSTFTSSLKDTEAEKNTISLTSLSERYTSTVDTEYCDTGARVEDKSEKNDTEGEVADGETSTGGEQEVTEDSDSKSTVKEAYDLIMENADKIFALLACISSLIIGFAYKKGLLPLVKNALSSLARGVSALKEETKRVSEGSTEALLDASEKLEKAENVIAEVSSRLERLEVELSESKSEALKDGELRVILTSQVDMLYEIFMSSSLPSYQKDAIGEKVAEMKRALSKEAEG